MKTSLYKLLLAFVVMFSYGAIGVTQEPSNSGVQIELVPADSTPVRKDVLSLVDLAQTPSFKLLGMQNAQVLEFTLRRDLVVESADLDLVFTPSPALLPRLSHLRVYLNDEMMGVVNIENEFPGQQVKRTVPLNPLMMTRFNRIRLEFVGHYTDICEDLMHTSLWLDISRQTQLRINQRMLSVSNDLSYFPEPFFDSADMSAQEIPFVFAGSPSNNQLRAGAVLSSYFGAEAKWRDLRHPVYFNRLPQNHAVVFATNESRPDFLRDYPKVSAPTVELMGLPDFPHYKMLLVLGRNDEDLVTAATALAIGSPIFRGRSVTIDGLEELVPRQPYDAPNWTPTTRPVYFSELISYPGQLEVSGLLPRPIDLAINLPPDLFVWRNSGIPMRILYRYMAPKKNDESRLTLSLNNRYIDSYPLRSTDEKGVLTSLRLPLRGDEDSRANESLLIPALKVGSQNIIRFDFSFGSIASSSQRDMCQTTLPVDVRAAIDQNSSIDFSGFHHFLAMPNLRAFAGSAFPFSRMADLSETVVVVPKQPSEIQAATFLEALGDMGSQIGYPALKVRVMDDWNEASEIDADVLLIGEMPDAMKARPDGNLLLQDARATLRQSRMVMSENERRNDDYIRNKGHKREAISEVSVRALAPMAAIVGLQSEGFSKRSIVGLLASTNEDYALLRDALASSGKREVMEGSVVLIRESGVSSELVGPVYYLGKLPWWERVWYFLSDRPWSIAGLAFVLVLLIAVLVWNLLRLVARRRLERDA